MWLRLNVLNELKHIGKQIQASFLRASAGEQKSGIKLNNIVLSKQIPVCSMECQ